MIDANSTNREYLIAFLGVGSESGMGVSEDDVDIILLKGGITGSDPVDTGACDMAVYSRMSVVLRGMMQHVSEGGYSVSWNMELVKLFYASLCDELGVEDVLSGRPKVRNRSNRW